MVTTWTLTVCAIVNAVGICKPVVVDSNYQSEDDCNAAKALYLSSPSAKWATCEPGRKSDEH